MALAVAGCGTQLGTQPAPSSDVRTLERADSPTLVVLHGVNIDPDLHASAGAGPANFSVPLGVVHVPGEEPEVFYQDRVRLLVSRDVRKPALDVKLQEANLTRLSGAAAEGRELPERLESVKVSHQPQTFKRARGMNARTAVLLKPPTLLSTQEAAAAVTGRLGPSVTFSSEDALRFFGSVLAHNAASPDLPLSVDFISRPSQGPFVNSEDASVPDVWRDSYAINMRLGEAWQLAVAAERTTPPTPPLGINIAIVDQGFRSEPEAMHWDYLLKWRDGFDVPASSGEFPWHGTHCGSLANAAVNDGAGAAGTALHACFSNVPSSGVPRVLTTAVVLPRGPVSMNDLAAAIDGAVFIGMADVVSVSWTSWCGSSCRASAGAQWLEEVLERIKAGPAVAVFSAGNDSEELSLERGRRYVVGCQGGGALCVGAVDRSGARLNYSNRGPAVSAWGPGETVWVNPLPHDSSFNRSFDGTSAAAAYVAGVVALMETHWDRRLNTDQARTLLRDASRRLPNEPPLPAAEPIVDVRQLLLNGPRATSPATVPGVITPAPSTPAPPPGPPPRAPADAMQGGQAKLKMPAVPPKTGTPP